MQIVIDISEERYTEIQNMDWKNPIWASEDISAIHNGTPLNEMLDKIRAEIQATIDEERIGNGNINKGVVIGLQMSLDTIDKYREE